MAEVIPQLGLAIGLLFSFMGLIMARGSIATWTHSFGFLLEWLASELDFSIHYGLGTLHLHLGGPFHRANGFVLSALQAWADGAEIEFGYFLHGNAILWEWTSKEIALTAEAAANFGDWLVHVRLPRWAKIIGTVVFPWPAIYRAIADAISKERHHAKKQAQAIENDIPRVAKKAATAAVAATLPAAVLFPWLNVTTRDLFKWATRVNWRLHKLEGITGAAAFAALMANVLGLPNWRCLTRGNIGRGARAFCGLDRWLVDLLLLGSIEAFIVTDLCEFSDLLISEAESVRPVLLSLVDVEDALIDCHGTSAPIELTLPPLSLSPMPDVSALAA